MLAIEFFLNSLVCQVRFSGVRCIAIFTIRICQVRLHRHLSFTIAVSGHLLSVLSRGKFQASLNRFHRFITLLNGLNRIIAFLSRLWLPFTAVILGSLKVFFRSHFFDSFKCFPNLFKVVLVFFLLMLSALEHFFRKIAKFLELSGFSSLKFSRAYLGSWFRGFFEREKI